MTRTAVELKADVDWRWETINRMGAEGTEVPEWFMTATFAVTAEWREAVKEG